MLNIWSLGRFPSTGGNNIINSALNSIGYFAYSTNCKIVIIDLSSMIDGNNGNLFLRSNTYNRFLIDLQKIDTSINPWLDFKIDLISKKNDNFNNITIKSIFVNEITWGPFMYYRWSLLFTSLNNGLIYIWLIPNIDSFCLSSYSLYPCFELIKILYYSIKKNEKNKFFEYDWNSMKNVKDEISKRFCIEFRLNTDTPRMNSSVISIQKIWFNEEDKSICFLSACWNEFIIIYEIIIENNNNNNNDKSLLENIFISDKKKEFLDILPILPKINCLSRLLTYLPMKNANEIITCCYISDFWNLNNDLFFELYIGTSLGKLFIFRYKVENKIELICIDYKLIYRAYPSISISCLTCEIIENNEHIWCICMSKNIIIGKSIFKDNLIECKIFNSINNDINHQLPIKHIRIMNNIVYNQKLYKISFFSIDKDGIGILYLINIEKNDYYCLRILTMNKLSDSQSVFPNFDNNINNINEETDLYKNLKTQNITFESLQNVPSSVKLIKKNNSDYKLVSFSYCSISGNFNFLKNNLKTYSIILLYSGKLNTIRLLLMFNCFSPIDEICNRIRTHISQTEFLLDKNFPSKELFCIEKYSRIISNTFTVNDIRLVLAGPLTMNKIPILEEMNEETKLINNKLNESLDNKIKYYSFLNFKFGKILYSKIELNNKDMNSDEILSIFSSLFFENIPIEIIKDALIYNDIEEQFEEKESNYKLILCNIILIIICYITEIEIFIPKCMEYLVNYEDKNNIKLFIESLLKLVKLKKKSEFINNNDDEEQFNYLLKLLYLIRITNCLRCMVLILYSRSNDTIDNFTIKREEYISNYLLQLQYYVQIKIDNLNSEKNMIDVNIYQSYIWNCIKNFQPINISELNQLHFKKLIENSCSLIADKPFNKYQCLYNHNKNNENTEESFTDTILEKSKIEDCIYSVPICPITFLPINIFENLKHLSCNSCGKIMFIPFDLINSKNQILSEYLSTNIFERYCLKNSYMICQICLNLTNFLEI